MELVVYMMGGLALTNCAVGLLTGNMYFFFKAPDEFIGAIRTVSRSEIPAAFWIFFLVTLGFGFFAIRFAYTNF